MRLATSGKRGRDSMRWSPADPIVVQTNPLSLWEKVSVRASWHNARPSPRPSPRGRGRMAAWPFFAILPLIFVATAALAQAPDEKAFPPHRVIGNVYYVGSKDLASYLITTPEGHLLINSGFERTVPLIRASVEALGFKMADVKILLASHAHADHGAGHAALREWTGPQVYVMRGD